MVPNNMQMLMDLLNGKDPSQVFNTLMNSNPQFAKFVNENKNNTPEQIMNRYGIDPSLLKLFNIERK